MESLLYAEETYAIRGPFLKFIERWVAGSWSPCIKNVSR